MNSRKSKFGGRTLLSGATHAMRDLFWAHRTAAARKTSVEHILEEQHTRSVAEQRYRRGQVSRRDFLRLIGLGAAAALPFSTAACDPSTGIPIEVPTEGPTTPQIPSDARIVIIGAGLAGLRCAHLLDQHNIHATVYEAADRIGGRVFSDQKTFGRQIERGGEFISSSHERIRKLVPELGLELEPVDGGVDVDGDPFFRIDNHYYTYEDATADWREVWKAFRKEQLAAPWMQTYDSFTPRGQELDNLSAPEWFDPAHPQSNPLLAALGPDSAFAKLCYALITAAYGSDPADQPALNLLYMLAWTPGSSLEPYFGGDFGTHIAGGNEQLAQKLAERVSDRLHLGKALAAIQGDASGPYTCSFADGSSVKADKLILALPFRILRELDIDTRIWEALPPAQQQAIQEMPMGTNAKVHYELAEKTWGPNHKQMIGGREREFDGLVYTDPDDIQLIWDSSVPVTTGPAVFTHFSGGQLGASLSGETAFGAAHDNDVERLLASAEAIFPGTRAAYTGRTLKSHLAASPWQKGAYTAYGIGNYTTFVGAAGQPAGNIHFAGEHTSVELACCSPMSS